MQLSDPAELGFSPARLTRIDDFLRERYIATGRFKGVQVLVAREGEIVHFASHGSAGEDGTAIADDQLFRIASMTKPITSIAFMQLVEEGRVALDDPVHRVLPELRDVGVYAGGGGDVPFQSRPTAQPMRMVDLLRHTAGFTYGFQNRGNIDLAHRQRDLEAWHGNLDLDGFIRELAKLPLEFSPGEGWNYSVATDVLGAVVQRVADKPLADVFGDRILTPLGMEDTFFHAPAEKVDRLGDCYAFTPDNPLKLIDRAGARSAWAKAPTLVSGGGGLVSTSADYHRFCSMLLGAGQLDGTRIIARKTLELMTANHLPGGADLASISQSLFSEASYAGMGFGLGFAVVTDPAKTLIPCSTGEFSWGGMFSTAFFVDPVERIHMVFMAQLAPSSTYPVRRELKTLIYSALED